MSFNTNTCFCVPEISETISITLDPYQINYMGFSAVPLDCFEDGWWSGSCNIDDFFSNSAQGISPEDILIIKNDNSDYYVPSHND